ncbi:MAG: ammonia-forming cytochrome c nitrite reductase subunit c552 [Solobacterium sp.]|nr:ammonia-forming cytochrome c nitrite reductase subunit c552 [Solobacterium sp.]
MEQNKNLAKVFGAGLIVLGGVLGVMGGSANKDTKPAAAVQPEKTAETAAAETQKPAPEPVVQTAKAAETGTGVVVTKADDWAEQYPNEYATYMQNNDNDEIHSYLELHPYLKTIYEGYGFAIQYGSARGHTYVVEDVQSTGRPHKMANCYTCKTSSMTAKVLNEGDSVYSMNFDDLTAEITDPFGCFHCHENEPGVLTVTHRYLYDALADDFGSVDPATMSCGQCHSEYHFAPDTKATTLAYTGLAKMNPDDMLDFYNTGFEEPFYDWIEEDTGVKKLKVQHPEFETFLGEGSPHRTNMTCADCHMGQTTAEDGTVFTNHFWTSPLDNQDLLDSNCSKCHKDLAAEVEAVHERINGRTDELGERLAALDDKLAEAVAAGTLSEEDLEQVREDFRSAQWYWDFVFVENGDGAHNEKLAAQCLDSAESYMDKIAAVLGE